MTDGRLGRAALVLGGGGVTGAWFEMGVLRALDAALTGLHSTSFQVVVGVSCGAVVGSHVAAGIAPHRLIAALGDSKGDVMAPFLRRHVLKPNWGELAQRTARLPRNILDAAWLHATGRNEASIPETLWALGEALPSGVLDGSGLENFLHDNLVQTSCGDRWSGLAHELYVVAVDVDTGESVVFGTPDHQDMPISRAVLASSSFPPAFAPCRIHGRDYVDGGVDKNFHLDVAVAAGASLLICVNPLLPLFNDPGRLSVRLLGGKPGRVADKGLPSVMDQAVRMILHGRMARSVEDVQKDFPDVDVLMLEPAPEDYEVFRYNVARFSARAHMARLGYASARASLLRHWDKHQAMLARHGVGLRRDILDAEMAQLEAAPTNRKRPLEVLGQPPAPR